MEMANNISYGNASDRDGNYSLMESGLKITMKLIKIFAYLH